MAVNQPPTGDAEGTPGAVEVRVPTILRTYTSGAKVVHADGTSLQLLVEDLEARYPGLKERLTENDALRRFVNVYVNDEDVRFLGGLQTPLLAGDSVTVLPAVAGGSA